MKPKIQVHGLSRNEIEKLTDTERQQVRMTREFHSCTYRIIPAHYACRSLYYCETCLFKNTISEEERRGADNTIANDAKKNGKIIDDNPDKKTRGIVSLHSPSASHKHQQYFVPSGENEINLYKRY